MRVWLIRHGMTKGNKEHRYVGISDESILSEEWERLETKADRMEFHPAIVFVSPARRCIETAMCLFPGLRGSIKSEYATNTGVAVTATAIMAQARWGCQRMAENADGKNVEQKMVETGAPRLIVVPEFMEMNFGAFEYKTYQEINADPDPANRAAYQHYIDTNGEAAFPGGESKTAFTKRVCEGFERAVLPVLRTQDSRLEVSDAGDETTGVHILREDGSSVESPALERSPSGGAPSIAIVAHGGTIMALMERYAEPKKCYFEWSVKPGEGYAMELDLKTEKLIFAR